MAELRPMELLSSALLTPEELGADLVGLSVTVRISKAGVIHVPQCRQVGKYSGPEETLTVEELRAAGEFRACRTCGGANVEKLSSSQTKQLGALAPIFEVRLEQLREVAREKRAEQDRVRRADMIDERAVHILNGWTWRIERERRLAERYPADHRAAVVTCTDCSDKATIRFDPRSLDVSYRCSANSEHGFRRLGDDKEPLTLWRYETENELVALGLIAPLLAADDGAWAMTYADRVDDYRTTLSALEDFDRLHPPAIRLTPDIRCGDCGDPLSFLPGSGAGANRIETQYACANRHPDGKYRHRDKITVDDEIDRILHYRLRDHPSWATAPELQLDPNKVAAYADDLATKIAIYDARVGAANSVDQLVKIRSQMVEELDLVAGIHDRGALAIADLTRYASSLPRYFPRWDFTELARALLTDRIDVTSHEVTVVTPFDEGTPQQRLLRSREIREELSELRQRQSELEEELAELNRTDDAKTRGARGDGTKIAPRP